MSSDQQYPYDPQAGPPGGQPYDPNVTQTWEGQTWDTQYQPTVRPQAAVSYDTAYLPPQGQTQEQAQGHPQGQPYAYGHADGTGTGTGTGTGDAGFVTTGGRPLPAETAYPPAYGTAAPAPAPAPVTYETPERTPEQAPAPAAAGPAYSSPTTSGHTRLTDAQRARAEGRSPIIDPGMQPAALTAVLGLLLAGGAAVGPYALLVPLVLLQAVTAAGWFRLNGMWPARQGIALAFLGGVTADAALLAAGREHAPAAILGTLGVWVLLALVLQLRSHADPDERMYGLTATVVSAALAVLAAGHLGAEPDAVVVGAVAVAATALARALPLPGPVSVVVALFAAAGAGIAAGGFTDLGTGGALLGLGAGVCALVGLRVAAYDYPSRFVHMTAGVALPLTAAVPAVHLLGRALA
ncbi:hypothetical protein ABZ135_27860 [Streptomyces sp. NPDC006339]|uniref:hypothetical protein n=1 Tax=Streptomyces sp. NPDC006339 TaxID=3156755 RepID=UPI00339EE385